MVHISAFEEFLLGEASLEIMQTHILPRTCVSDHRVFASVSRVTNAFALQCQQRSARISLYDFTNTLSRMMWLMSQGYPMRYPCPVVSERVAKDGNIPLLKWLAYRNCLQIEAAMCAAAECGRLDIMLLIQSLGACSLNGDAARAASENGHVHVLNWLRERGGHASEYCFADAARGGHQVVIDWLISQGNRVPHGELLRAAAEGGHLNMMKAHVRRLNHGFFPETPSSNFFGDHLASSLAVLHGAAAGGHVVVLEWLQTLPKPQNLPSSRALSYAVASGHKTAAVWLTAKKCRWNTSITLEAASKDGSMLMWLRHQGCPWNKDAILWEVTHRRNRKLFEWVIAQSP
jgi:hypothetical protein